MGKKKLQKILYYKKKIIVTFWRSHRWWRKVVIFVVLYQECKVSHNSTFFFSDNLFVVACSSKKINEKNGEKKSRTRKYKRKSFNYIIQSFLACQQMQLLFVKYVGYTKLLLPLLMLIVDTTVDHSGNKTSVQLLLSQLSQFFFSFIANIG